MCRWLRRIEQRFAQPHLHDVLQPEVGVLEEMSRLSIDLEGRVVVQRIEVEPVHDMDCNSLDYE